MEESGKIRLSFMTGPDRTQLAKGEQYLELASRVALARPQAP
jgi:hypothetical protein